MSAAKHTPGPWSIARDGVTIVSNQSHPVAVLSAPFHRQVEGGTGNDAPLIAAAPELLHELELQADTLADLAKTLRLLGKDMLAKACEIAEGSARATIAKALGSAS